MTLFKPSLFLSRLIVMAEGRIVYGEKFHQGLNVIYGENASGKSTILEFIFHALGGDGARFKQEARLCDKVLAEVFLNSEKVTLSRDVDHATRMPTYVFWGGIDEAVKSSTIGWQKYSYNRSASKDSFSDVMFRALGMPKVPSSDKSNITMYQLLRTMYEDQMSSPAEILKHDDFDQMLTRQTIGELICGVYDPQLYEHCSGSATVRHFGGFA